MKRAAILLLALCAAAAHARVIRVDVHTPGPARDGETWETAHTDLQTALGLATSGDEIWVAAGRYNPGSTREDSFEMVEGVATYGGFAGTETSRDERDWELHETILSGDIGAAGDASDNSYHVVIGASDARLDGFSVTSGNADGVSDTSNGGGMDNLYVVNLTVANCAFVENSAKWYGGGISNDGTGHVTVIDCTFTGNSAMYGGGMDSLYVANLTVTDCTFADNSADAGGGMTNCDVTDSIITGCTFAGNSSSAIYNSNASPDITNCLFAGNSARSGGGIGNSFSFPRVDGCTFTSNSADYGGGMSNFRSSPEVTNCIFTGNSVTGRGGGMGNDWGSSPRIINCTFTGNSAGVSGAGMVNIQVSYPEVVNCIFWANTAPAWAEIRDDVGDARATVAHSCIQGGYEGVGNIAQDPLFVDAAKGDLHLRSGSPCIDAGTASGAPDHDLDGNVRPFGAAVDMGAYEWPPTSFEGVWFVDADAPAGGNGEGWRTAFRHPQDALDAASAGEQVWVAEGTYVRGNSADTVVLAMKDGVALYGGFAGTETSRDARDWAVHETILDGEEMAWHVVTGASDAALDGFTVTRGSATGDTLTDSFGGGMLNRSVANLTVANCAFTANWASDGGGMYSGNDATIEITSCTFAGNSATWGAGVFVGSGSPTLTDCTFTDNSARECAGGMWNGHSSSPVITDCVFAGNSTTHGSGGGVCNSWGSLPMIANCTFAGNSANYHGGGMINAHCIATIEDCSFTGNSAACRGGGMYNLECDPTIVNCVFAHNSTVRTDGWGGGMCNDLASPKITNCTFTGNSAGARGGAICDYHHTSAEITNCILWDNSASDGPEIHTCESSSSTVSYSCLRQGGHEGEGNIDADPLFVDPANGDLHLQDASPCIDAGTSTGAPDHDLDGNPRPSGDGVDMGAYEFGDRDGDGMPDGWELANGLDPDDPGDAGRDNDNDGLTNLEEFRAGTDPRLRDTDGDGFLDGAEIEAGTDPLDATQHPPLAWYFDCSPGSGGRPVRNSPATVTLVVFALLAAAGARSAGRRRSASGAHG